MLMKRVESCFSQLNARTCRTLLSNCIPIVSNDIIQKYLSKSQPRGSVEDIYPRDFKVTQKLREESFPASRHYWEQNHSPPLSNECQFHRLTIRGYNGIKQGQFSAPATKEIDGIPADKFNHTQPVVYYGAFSSTLRNVKILSLSTCVLSVTLGPIITFFTAPGLNVFAKGTVAALMVMFSAGTTGGLHWFTSPYVHKLTWTPGSAKFTVQTLSWIGTFAEQDVELSAVKYADTQRPLVTFEANGRYYFVDKDNFPDEKLLLKLLPEEPQDTQ